MTLVIINEQHSLFEEQVEKLNERFGKNGWERFEIPAGGIDKQKAAEIIEEIGTGHVFASPIPVLMALMARRAVVEAEMATTQVTVEAFFCFHNDVRIKKEIPDRNNPGQVKIINTVSPEGWEIV